MKVGDRVVYIGGCEDPQMTCPKPNVEVCIISGESINIKGNFYLKGYEYASDGFPQSFDPCHLRKLTPPSFKNKLTKELAEQLNEELLKPQIEESEIFERSLY